MRPVSLSLALGLWLIARLAVAQIPEALADRPIGRVEIVGESSGATGARDIGVPLGARLSRTLLRSTVERLLADFMTKDLPLASMQIVSERQLGEGMATVVVGSLATLPDIS